MTSYGNDFYEYMRHQKFCAGLKVFDTRDLDKQYSEFQLLEFHRYKKTMKKWRFRIKFSQVIKERKLGCYNCRYFYIPLGKSVVCNENHIHLPKITCDDYKPSETS